MRSNCAMHAVITVLTVPLALSIIDSIRAVPHTQRRGIFTMHAVCAMHMLIAIWLLHRVHATAEGSLDIRAVPKPQARFLFGAEDTHIVVPMPCHLDTASIRSQVTSGQLYLRVPYTEV